MLRAESYRYSTSLKRPFKRCVSAVMSSNSGYCFSATPVPGWAPVAWAPVESVPSAQRCHGSVVAGTSPAHSLSHSFTASSGTASFATGTSRGGISPTQTAGNEKQQLPPVARQGLRHALRYVFFDFPLTLLAFTALRSSLPPPHLDNSPVRLLIHALPIYRSMIVFTVLPISRQPSRLCLHVRKA